jgi:c-di-GMP-related signal transduction protein
MLKKPRKNLNKDEIKAKIAQEAKIAKLKEIVAKVFPLIEDTATIYDAQTVLQGLAGLLSAGLETKITEFKVSDIELDLSNEEKSAITDKVQEVYDLLKDESANDVPETLDRLGGALQQYTTSKYMKNPMSEIKITDIMQ